MSVIRSTANRRRGQGKSREWRWGRREEFHPSRQAPDAPRGGPFADTSDAGCRFPSAARSGSTTPAVVGRRRVLPGTTYRPPGTRLDLQPELPRRAVVPRQRRRVVVVGRDGVGIGPCRTWSQGRQVGGLGQLKPPRGIRVVVPVVAVVPPPRPEQHLHDLPVDGVGGSASTCSRLILNCLGRS